MEIFGREYAKQIDKVVSDYLSLNKSKTYKCVFIQIGNDAGSSTYITLKKKKAKQLGIKTLHIKYSENVSNEKLIERIARLNLDKSVNGIMIQSPLKNHDLNELASYISPEKDFDGMNPASNILPATVLSILLLIYSTLAPKNEKEFFEKFKTFLKNPNDFLKNKKICIINDSIIIGLPLSKYLSDNNIENTVCNKYSQDIKSISSSSDIVVTATGLNGLIGGEWVNPNSIVIDCGFPFSDLSDKAKTIVHAYTPVPGGVGPLTVAFLFYNLVLHTK